MQTLWTVVAVAVAKALRITPQEMFDYVSAMVSGAAADEAPGSVGGDLVGEEATLEDDDDEESGTRKFGFR
jgi:hypothetical protein